MSGLYNDTIYLTIDYLTYYPDRKAGREGSSAGPARDVRKMAGYRWRIGWGKGRTAFWHRRAGLPRAGRHKKWGRGSPSAALSAVFANRWATRRRAPSWRGNVASRLDGPVGARGWTERLNLFPQQYLAV